MQQKTTGIVLRHADYKDYHRMLTLFTPDRGRLSASAPASRRPKSALAQLTEVFTLAEFILEDKGGRLTLTGGDIIDSFYDLRMDLENLGCALYMRDFCETVVGEGHGMPELFTLFAKALSMLCYNKLNHRIVRCAFDLKAMDIAGFRPVLDSCSNCGKALDSKVYFSPSSGGAVCAQCTKPADSFEMGLQALGTMGQMQRMPIENVVVIRVKDEILEDIKELMIRYMRYYLNRKFKSSDFLNNIYPA